ncbi:MAG: ABC transporter ATP-binding protein, partial [Lachnospiraceae bacterium]|nr:ABC transporter ATP-binding protein [Lachnospiraceae bacterium]
MKRLLIYLKDYRKESVLGPLFKLLEASFELLVPLVMAAVIDRGIANRDTGYVTRMCLVMVALGFIGLVCSVTAQYFAAKAAVGFATGVRGALFSHIQGLSYTEIDTLGTSTMITRMTSDVNQAQSGVNMTLRLFLRSPFIVFGAMVMAFTINFQAAMVFVVTIPLLSVVVFGIMMVTMPLYKKVQAGLDKVLGITRENLTGVRVLRAFNKEEEERERFSERNESLTRMQVFAGRISALMNPLTYVIINGAVAALIWTGAIQVDGGIISQGQVVALVNYMSQILVELIKLANLIITITKALACAGRIASVLETESSMTAPEVWGETKPAQRGTVEFSDACLHYKNAGAESLSHVSFRAERGETIGVIGGTGSGKSSLVNLIPRFYDVSSGQVLVDGVNVKDYPTHALREKISVVPQKAVLFKGSIRENLQWGKAGATEEELWEALEISQAKEFVEKKEQGLDTPVAQGGKNLSGGQRQRLTIARALVKKPEILILDDSASALDFATDLSLRMAIRDMKEKLTVFVVSQRASSVRYADKIIVLEDGEVAGIGSHETLLESCSVYQEIYY